MSVEIKVFGGMPHKKFGKKWDILQKNVDLIGAMVEKENIGDGIHHILNFLKNIKKRRIVEYGFL